MMRRGYYIFIVVSFVLEVLFLLFMIFCLILGVGRPIEWIILIIGEIIISIPGDIRLIKKYEELRDETHGQGDGSPVPTPKDKN